MLVLRTVLFPTDYGPCADRAFAHAAFLAAHHGAELQVLHVTPPFPDEEAPQPVRPYPVPAGVEAVEVTDRADSAVESIVEAARAADLVVMGTHGRRGVDRLRLGSTTEGVLRAVDCPVLAVGMAAGHTDPADVQRVLAPVDFSESSGVALAVADGLAALYGARVDALHAAYVPDLPEVYGVGLQFEGTYPQIVARAGESLRSLLRRFVAPDRRGEAVVRVGPPGPTIVEEAERIEAGLLVVPTHGRTGLSRLAYGSVAEHVLRRAPCPVFALKSFGRIPLPEDDEVARPTARPSPELADAFASHDV